MIHRTLYIRSDWKVDVFIDTDKKGTYLDEVLDCLESMGAPFRVMERCEEIVASGKPNQAFTYSNSKRTCIYIGWATDGSEFINSVVHEIRHLVDHIAGYYGIKGNGEQVGYISGDAAIMLAEDICKYGCPHCRKETTK